MASKVNPGLRALIQEMVEQAITERNLDVPNVDSNVLSDAMSYAIAKAASHLAMESVMSIEEQLNGELLKALNVNLIGVETPTPGPSVVWNKATLRDIEMTVEDQLAQLQEQCMDTVTEALASYYQEYASIIAHAANDGGGDY